MDIAFFFIGDLSWSCRKQGTVAKMRRASFYPLYYFTLLSSLLFLVGPSSIVADVEKGTLYYPLSIKGTGSKTEALERDELIDLSLAI